MSNTSVSDWASSVRTGVGDALHSVITFIPNVLGALVVLLIGVIVGYVLKIVVVRVLHAIKLQSLVSGSGLNRVFPGKYNLVELIGDLVKWFFIIVFLLQALSIVNLLGVNDLVRSLLAYVPRVFAAVVLVLIGAIVADLVHRLVVDAARVVGASTARLLGDLSKYTILAVVTFTALAQLGVNTTFLNDLFIAIVAMLALAGGLAFGLGGRELARDVLSDMRQSFKREQ